MKNTKIIAFFLLTFMVLSITLSCDKVKNPYPIEYVDIDTTLLDGITLEEYKNSPDGWPSFTNNTNVNLNVLIEDYTGSQCINCPYAHNAAEEIVDDNLGRVFVASIHSSPVGMSTSQAYTDAPFLTNFTNQNGFDIAIDLASKDPYFDANPAGTFNRRKEGIQISYSYSPSSSNLWASFATSLLNANDLKVNLQSKANYFPATRGIILHTEVELKSSSLNDSSNLYQVVYLIEDSLVAPQITPSAWTQFPGGYDPEYIHRNIMRGCLDGKSFGRKLMTSMKVDKNGNVLTGNKYYINYSYKLPAQYNKDNMHLLIFVYDGETNQILQVVKQDL